MSTLIYNNNYTDISQLTINQDNRAFFFGDFIFETLIYSQGNIRFLDSHINRIERGMHAFKMNSPFKDLSSIKSQILFLIDNNSLQKENLRVKLFVWRKEGGLYTPSNNDSNYLILISGKAKTAVIKNKVQLYTEYPVVANPISQFKTGNCQPYTFAGLYAKETGLDDVILLNTSNYIAECISSNIYWIKDDIIYSPSINTGCVRGVLQEQIEEIHTIQYGEFTKKDLLSADSVFTSNVTGVSYIAQIEDVTFNTNHAIVNELIQRFAF